MEGEHYEYRADEYAVEPLEISILECSDNGVEIDVALADGVTVLVVTVDSQE